MRSTYPSLLLAAALSCAGAAFAADSTQKPPQAPVAQPETDPALSTSGEVVPGQPVRPESTQEAAVPKTPKDKEAASSADVGAGKVNEKAERPGAGSSTVTPPKE